MPEAREVGLCATDRGEHGCVRRASILPGDERPQFVRPVRLAVTQERGANVDILVRNFDELIHGQRMHTTF